MRPALERALDAFAESGGGGSREAYARARIALERAAETVDMLETRCLDPSGAPEVGAQPRRGGAPWCASSTCCCWRRGERSRACHPACSRAGPASRAKRGDRRRRARRRAAGAVAPGERGGALRDVLAAVTAGAAARGAGPTVMAHQRKLRALHHLIDAEKTELEDDQARRGAGAGAVETSTCRGFQGSRASRRKRSTPLRRAVAATVARALDALVRDGAADPADALLYAAHRTAGPGDLPGARRGEHEPGGPPPAPRVRALHRRGADAALRRELADPGGRSPLLEGARERPPTAPSHERPVAAPPVCWRAW